MQKRKICVITSGRADFGLLTPLLKELVNDKKVELQLVATGMHLSEEFGFTYKQIEKQGFDIIKKMEILSGDDSSVGVAKTMSNAQIKSAEVFEELKPDIVVILGDRYEMLPIASSAMVARIPIAHLYGGEATEGLVDEAVRHSLTKMSHLHFTSTEEYKKRVIQLGEQPQRVFNVGAIGIDNIKDLPLLSRENFEESINFNLNKRNYLVTYHPVTLDENGSSQSFKELLGALDELEDTNIIFTKANADADGRVINLMIEDYVKKNSQKCVCFDSLGQLRYLSALKYVDGVIGNSSSGIIEVPSFKIVTINIGDRQKKRIQAQSVINCPPKKEFILEAILKSMEPDFQEKLKTVENPYGEGGVAVKIKNVLKTYDISDIIKKEFYNLEFSE